MNRILFFVINAVGFGIGLAMDAFSVSAVNAMYEPQMDRRRSMVIAGTFAGFQIAMPLIGWTLVRTVISIFTSFHRFIPWIALILLLYIGGKMLLEGIRGVDEESEKPSLSTGDLLIQGVATSIDALSVGFAIADYKAAEAVVEALIIGAVTFAICLGGIWIGKRFGTKLSGKASLAGGLILILIGIEIFIRG